MCISASSMHNSKCKDDTTVEKELFIKNSCSKFVPNCLLNSNYKNLGKELVVANYLLVTDGCPNCLIHFGPGTISNWSTKDVYEDIY